MSNSCLNCGASLEGSFCAQCGQRDKDADRSLKHLIGELINNLFFVDNRIWASYKYLVFKPGIMTYEFLEGKRRKFMPPVTLFLFVNVLYFFISPLTDYSLTLTDQMKQPTHGALATRMVEEKLTKVEMDFETYAPIYRQASDNVSKTIMILNVPMIAFFVYLLAIRKRKYYFDSLIFSMHFFTIFLLCIVVGVFTAKGYYLIVNQYFGSSIGPWVFWMPTFMAGLPLLYAIISFKRFAQVKWYHAIWSGLFIMFAGIVTQFIYRSFVFFTTFWLT
ncbi:MAG: DUF3667 domain-containing protein [Reichenbachiella sp.]|uniref:DUF3667 domain-containing protein n=1 Tax=Reichenbachiella sp. TaxID=2184521 RepID=UPI0032995EAB